MNRWRRTRGHAGRACPPSLWARADLRVEPRRTANYSGSSSSVTLMADAGRTTRPKDLGGAGSNPAPLIMEVAITIFFVILAILLAPVAAAFVAALAFTILLFVCGLISKLMD